MVFRSLGLSAEAEAVYRMMLRQPTWSTAELAESLGVTVADVQDVLGELLEHALVRESHTGLRPTSPEAGLTALLARARASNARQQSEIEETQLAVDALTEAYDTNQHEQLIQLDTLEAVRDQLEHLARRTQVECLSFNPGGAHRHEAMAAGKPVNQTALERGVSIKAVYQDSFRNDPARLAYARWFTDLGGEIRTMPLVLFQMIIVDRSVALLPVDPTDAGKGAIEIHNPAIMTAVCALFDQVWSTATPFGSVATADGNGLDPTERELLRLLGDGHTDEAAARKLGLSVRTIQRIMSDLTQRLGAEGRFQAGTNAVRQRWV